MSEEVTPVTTAATVAPKKPSAKKAAATKPVADKTAATKASTAKRTASSKTATSAPKRKPATKATAIAVPSAPVAADGTLGTVTSKVTAMMPEGLSDKAKEMANEVKDKASDAVENLGKLIGDSAAAIDDNVGPKYGDYARSAAQSVTDAADRLRAKPVDEIASDTREFVRNKPGTAVGIAAVASLLLAKIFGSIFGRRR